MKTLKTIITNGEPAEDFIPAQNVVYAEEKENCYSLDLETTCKKPVTALNRLFRAAYAYIAEHGTQYAMDTMNAWIDEEGKNPQYIAEDGGIISVNLADYGIRWEVEDNDDDTYYAFIIIMKHEEEETEERHEEESLSLSSNDSTPDVENATTTKEIYNAVEYGGPNPIVDKIVGNGLRGYLQRIYSYCKKVLNDFLPEVEMLPMATTSASGYYGKTSMYMFGKAPVYKISLSRKVLNNSTILQAMTTCCHEFAHLTYWDHGKMHATLTKKYLEIVTNSLGGE